MQMPDAGKGVHKTSKTKARVVSPEQARAKWQGIEPQDETVNRMQGTTNHAFWRLYEADSKHLLPSDPGVKA